MIYKKKILVVDGDPNSEKNLKPILQKADYKPLFVSKASEGLKIAEEWVPHIILLDLVLPNMSGLGFLRKIKNNPRLKKISILILSDLNDFDIIQEALDLGAKGFLTKTYTPNELITMVKDYAPNYVWA